MNKDELEKEAEHIGEKDGNFLNTDIVDIAEQYARDFCIIELEKVLKLGNNQGLGSAYLFTKHIKQSITSLKEQGD